MSPAATGGAVDAKAEPKTKTATVNQSVSRDKLDSVRAHIASCVIGQQRLVDGMLICLISDGHLLVEGLPGLAKTTAVKALSEAIEGDFHRVQFTPDLLPSDLVGTDIYRSHRELL